MLAVNHEELVLCADHKAHTTAITWPKMSRRIELSDVQAQRGWQINSILFEFLQELRT